MIVHSFVIVSAAFVVTRGSTTPPSIREDSLLSHPKSSLLYTLLQVAGFSETCVSGVLDYCSSAQEEAHYPSLIQELQENKMGLQEMKVELQDVKEMMQQEIQDIKAELQDVKVEEHKGVEMVQQIMLTLKMARPRHCMDLLLSGDSRSGLRKVHPYSNQPDHSVTVYCDQIIDGGGWTVFQRRVNNIGRQNFYRNWTEYQAGFGDLNGEFWMGLDLLHVLTKTEQVLRIDLHDYEGAHRWAKYGTFRVGSTDTNYRLTIGRYSGDAGDGMAHNKGQQFSTNDNDNDGFSSTNCAERDRGGWWYNYCTNANLNGYQHVGHFTSSSSEEGIIWSHWRGHGYSLKRTSMMIRPAF